MILKPRLTLLILIAIFVIPMFMAGKMYFSSHSPLPKPLNRGILLNPLLQYADLEASAPLERRWTLLQVQLRPCEEQCKKNLYKINQVWLALGAEQDRVGRAILTAKEGPNPLPMDFIKENYPRLQLLLIPEKNLQSLAKHGELFVVDPLGNILLAYSETAPPDDLYSDLKRLLTVSQIG